MSRGDASTGNSNNIWSRSDNSHPQETRKRKRSVRNLSVWDELRENSNKTATFETVSSSSIVAVHQDGVTYRLAHLVGMLPISAGGSIASSFWLSLEVAAYLAVLDFNQRNISTLDTATLERLQSCNLYFTMDWRDTQFSPIEAGLQFQIAAGMPIPNAPQLQASLPTPTAILGPVRSVVSSIVASMGGTRDNPIPNISPGSTSRQLDQQDQYPYFSRTIPTNQGDAVALCTYLYRLGVPVFGVLYTNDSYGSEFLADVSRTARSLQLEVISAGYTQGIPSSLSKAVAELAQADLVYHMGIFSPPYADVIPELHRNGLVGPSSGNVWIFAEAVADNVGLVLDTSNEEEAILAEAMHGTGVILLRPPPESQELLTQRMSEFFNDRDLVQYYISRHGSYEAQKLLDNSFWTTFEPNPSIYSLLSYDAVLALGIAACDSKSAFFSGPELWETISNVSFFALTDQVSFDPDTGTRAYEHLEYGLINLVAEASPENPDLVTLVGYSSATVRASDAALTVETPFVYPDNTMEAPPSLPFLTEDTQLVGTAPRVFAYVLVAIGMLASIAAFGWSFYFRNQSIVKASQPIFLSALCVGTFLMSATVIPLTFQEPMSQRLLDVGCMAAPWLMSMGFTTTFAALFSKTWRLNRVFQNSRAFRRVKIRTRDVLGPFLVLSAINLTILVTWTVLDPLVWKRVPTTSDRFGRVTKSYGTCHHDLDNEVIFMLLLLGTNVAALLFSNYQSFVSRQLPSEWNETFYVSVTNFAMLEAVVLGGPIVFLVAGDPTASLVIRSILITIIVLAVLLPTFWPKLRHTKSRRRGQAGSQDKRSVVVGTHSRAKGRSSTPSVNEYGSKFSDYDTAGVRNRSRDSDPRSQSGEYESGKHSMLSRSSNTGSHDDRAAGRNSIASRSSDGKEGSRSHGGSPGCEYDDFETKHMNPPRAVRFKSET